MSDIKKIKRGLEDVSEIFQSSISRGAEVSKVEEAKEGAVEWVSVYSPGQPDDTFFLTAFLAAQFQARHIESSILTFEDDSLHNEKPKFLRIPEKEGIDLKRDAISRDDFLTLWAGAPDLRLIKDRRRHLVFLDTCHFYSHEFERNVPLVDKLIMHVQPNMECIMECYRAVKRSISLNAHLEYYFLFDGFLNDKRGEFLFERLSELVSQNLGVQLIWLGHFTLSQDKPQVHCRLEFDHLFFKEKDDSVESFKKRVILNQLRARSV